MRNFAKIGMVARWQPVHLGHLPVLRGMCEQADLVLIGVGSANRVNARNPFTLEERTEMIKIALEQFGNFELLPIDDLDDGPRWREMIISIFGKMDAFITENPYVASLLKHDYQILKPVRFVQKDKMVPLNASMVRREMARGNDWCEMVPEEIKNYILENDLDKRFRKNFGLETLALDASII